MSYQDFTERLEREENLILSVLLFLVFIIALCVRLPEVGAEQTSQVMSECDGLPTMEMGMPIQIERIRT